MAYALYTDVEAGFRTLSESEIDIVNALLEESAIIIDAYNQDADPEAKKLVSCRMIRRSIGDGNASLPMGATQGTMSALGYSQTWTMQNSGTTGELFLEKIEKKLLGLGNRIGCRSPLEGSND